MRGSTRSSPRAGGRARVHRQWDSDDDAKDAVVQAARGCFQRYGVNRTTMDDIAHEAGIARQYLYRFVAGREELLAAVVFDITKRLVEGLGPIRAASPSFTDAIVDVSVAAVERMRNDSELRNLFETTAGPGLHEIFLGPTAIIHDLALEFWAPDFAQARADSELSTDLTDHQIIDWFQGVYFMMVLRRDLEPDQERDMIRRFVLPALGPTTASSTGGDK
jgi:AcrR family transcriptional regulator